MKVLSLFDGMSCGMLALEKAGIKVDTYYASEIDKYAIEISKKNYPQIIQVGDVCDLDPNDFKDVDLIMGGSPCQGFSFAGKQLAFDDPRSALFFEFVRLLKAIKPKYFLLENVRMKKEYLQVITDMLGVEPIFINSALVSAQSRQRYYWTNIPNIQQPEDRGIVLRDILETEPENFTKMSDKFAKRQRGRKCLIDYTKEKASNLSAMEYVKNGRQGDYLACDYDGKPKQVGMASDIKGHDILRRVYSPEGKSQTLTSMGGGNTEPKVITGGAFRGRAYDKDGKRMDPDGSSVANKTKQMLELRKDGKSNAITTVGKDSVVADTEMHWRKLTPLECERLQTVPDKYTEGVSNTQRYKMLGNGWTVDVIAHIFNNIDDRFKQSI
jgi:DNA (cytosine-5)-methyltransferase 3A